MADGDASYTILDIKREGNFSRINCGPITFVSGMSKEQSTASASKYSYDFIEGAEFTITSHKEWPATDKQ